MEQAPNPQPTRVLTVDDHVLFREGLVRLLAVETDLAVAGQCGTLAEGLEFLAHSTVDLVLLDFQLEDGNALQFLRAARHTGYQGRIMLVTAQMSGEDCLHALQQGASGIFLKHNSPPALVRAIRLVVAGHLWIDPRVVQVMAEAVPSRNEEAAASELTDRERQVLQGICEGLTNRKIGDRIGMSESTVKATLQHLFHKTGVHTRSQLVRVALERPMRQAR